MSKLLALAAIVISLSLGGSSRADMTTTFAGTATHGGGGGGACTGAINLSTGCVTPMLGGL